WQATRYTAVLNPLMGAGLVLAVSLAGAFALRRRSLAGTLGRWSRHPADPREAVLWGLGLILGVMAFGLSFEIDRVIEQALARGGSLTWPPGQLKHLGW